MIRNKPPVRSIITIMFRQPMVLTLHNSMSGRKETFVPLDEQHVRMYVCGPTVYNYVHIGNGRPAVVFDVLFRLLRHLYPKVDYVRNITDVDDRIQAAAQSAGVSMDEIATAYIGAYAEDVNALGCLKPTREPRATEHVVGMIRIALELISRGHAYIAADHVLFHVPSAPSYGALSKRSLEQMIAGARVEVAPYKKHPADFVLWKPSPASLPGWNSPWGRGRPGWHLECTAMIRDCLGTTIDVHGGGSDLQFPHHENELAQACCSKPDSDYVRYWLHNGMLRVGNEKMAKSKGNFTTIRELRRGWSGETLRYALLSGHYRQSLDWSPGVLEQAKSSLDRIYQALRITADAEVREQQASPPSSHHPPQEILAALCDDLNTPLALALLHNSASALFRTKDQRKRRRLHAEICAAGLLLGLPARSPVEHFQQQRDSTAPLSPAAIAARIDARARARMARDFVAADRIRVDLEDQGIVLEDTRAGTHWRYAR